MRELVIRVRRSGDEYTATARQVAAGALLDAPSHPGTVDAIGTAATVPAAIIAAVCAARIPIIAKDKPLRPTHGGYPTIEPPPRDSCPDTARNAPTGRPDEAARIRHAYEAACYEIAGLIGYPPLEDGDLTIPAGVNLERIPAAALTAGHNAITFLAAGAGILDPDAPALEDVSPETALAKWTETRERP